MLTGRTIVVTGCASGIGAETAAELRRQGAAVVGVDRNPARGVDEHHLVDLRDPAAIDSLVDEALPGRVDGLCNIAGLPPTAPPVDVMTVNVLALRRLTERLAPRLSEGSAITNMASMAGMDWAESVELVKEFLTLDYGDDIAGFCRRHRLEEGARSYFLSKQCVQVYTMAGRWRWRDRGIRMNCLSPAAVDTPLLPDFMARIERAAAAEKVMDRHARPDDIAGVVAFLHTDAARWFRGANLTLDGGLSSHLLLQRHGLEPAEP
ncbi:MAG: SDR family oxidoreductase [Acidimicrobiaceae bacterium]|nr:coniferyl-alcohol dehydrogenase [Acidimicrobiaceae bacterium]MCY3649877.1 coniferyl-alcohol dehydrogenase [Acidimicrobiaceae bacterium]MDE0514856.1 coniferyl-alcohol dehydrogenase [Acidimicrobiaceae bacterium]MDE0656604.1 coniferyl-alcohol dehydrogenase [Acidimicrobiaceae bacterium]MXZ96193.1 SDR family oxidoreductase [Acidimicrobiaceae bacterium]